MTWSKWLGVLCLSVALTGCFERLSGTYNDPLGLTSITFQGSKVYMGALGAETEGSYDMDGDRVKLLFPGKEPMILRLGEDGALHGPLGVTWSKEDKGQKR